MFAALTLAALLQAAPPPDSCAHDRAALLALSPDAFDQDMDGGWRPLGDKPECHETAADLLAAYRAARWGELNPDQLHLNYWHEGQMRATLGQRDKAVQLLLAGVNPNVWSSGQENYALGTVAFLLNDRPALQAARDRLAATPKPEGFDDAAARFRAQYGRDLVWPMNLDVLDGLLVCFGQDYATAYGDCRP